MRRRRRTSDTPQFDGDTEKLRFCVGTLVQPIQRLAVLVAEFPREPHNHVCVVTCGVGEQFSQMVVIRVFELVLNDNWPILVQVGCQNI